MPADTMTEETGMDDAFYSGPGGTEKAEETKSEKPESVDEEESENPTALIPTSALGGKAKAGDTVTIRVVKVYDDEAEVEIVSGENKPKETMSAGDELDSMEKEY